MTKEQLEQQLKHHWDGGRRNVFLECDAGWYPIIAQLDKDIRKLAPDYTILQIKEKFGGLRYYIGALQENVFDQVYEIIEGAEKLAAKTCECCGEPGALCRRAGWLKTLCKSCFAEWTEYNALPAEYGISLG
jgi:hypothetical protein